MLEVSLSFQTSNITFRVRKEISHVIDFCMSSKMYLLKTGKIECENVDFGIKYL